MAARRQRHDASELEFCASWLRTVNTFVFERAPSAELAQIAEDGVARSVSLRNLRGLREAMRDSLEMASGMKPDDQDTLDRMLVVHTGKGLYAALRDGQRYVSRVLKRGRIANATEYRMLSSRADEIHSDPSADAELARVNELLRQYEDRTKP